MALSSIKTSEKGLEKKFILFYWGNIFRTVTSPPEKRVLLFVLNKHEENTASNIVVNLRCRNSLYDYFCKNFCDTRYFMMIGVAPAFSTTYFLAASPAKLCFSRTLNALSVAKS